MPEALLTMTKNEVVERLNEDYKAEITAYNNGREHVLMVADALTDGIVKQSPENLKNKSEKKRAGSIMSRLASISYLQKGLRLPVSSATSSEAASG